LVALCIIAGVRQSRQAARVVGDRLTHLLQEQRCF
jgi:hypothetical protein